MCTGARTQFHSVLRQARGGLGQPCCPPWHRGRPGARPHGHPRPCGPARARGVGRGRCGRHQGVDGGGASRRQPPVPLPGRWRCWPPVLRGLLPPSPRPSPPAGKPPSAYLHWVSAPHPPGQAQPSTTAKTTENRSQRGTVMRSRGAGVPGQGPRWSRSRRPAGQGAEGALAGGGTPEAEPLPPAGTEGPFVPPSPGGAERGTGGTAPGRGMGLARRCGGPERRPKGRSASPGAAVSDRGLTPGANASPAERSNGGTCCCSRHDRWTRAPLLPVKVNLAREGRGGRRAASHGRASLPSQCHRCLSPGSGGHGGVGIWPGVRAINCDSTTLPTDAAKPPGFSSSLMEGRATRVLSYWSQSPAPAWIPFLRSTASPGPKPKSSAVIPAAFWV